MQVSLIKEGENPFCMGSKLNESARQLLKTVGEKSVDDFFPSNSKSNTYKYRVIESNFAVAHYQLFTSTPCQTQEIFDIGYAYAKESLADGDELILKGEQRPKPLDQAPK
ncbi:MAG TPA: hypothetical protein DCE41_01190 [Cytophagales bacterium]|nr:hypothetical protein [Cytophagales bacterium]HAA17403.1 hypothetical protein [Cytophagales bacterium]HAP62029.1 hypothetical protein [Cytophagales bacterium]